MAELFSYDAILQWKIVIPDSLFNPEILESISLFLHNIFQDQKSCRKNGDDRSNKSH